MKKYFVKTVIITIIASHLVSCSKDQLHTYPKELTIENWEKFVHAPSEIIEGLMVKELDQRQFILTQRDKDIHNSNARVAQQGRVRAWVSASSISGNWMGLSDVSTSTTNSFATTDANGYYSLNTGTAFVCMEYNTPVMNGVSPLDLVLMQRHISGVDPFYNALTPSDAARRYVAADIDHDGVISVADVILLRKIIRGVVPFSGINIVFVPETLLTLSLITNPSFLSSSFLLDNCKPPSNNYMARYAIKVGDISGDFYF